MGIVLETMRHESPVRPNMAHPLVQQFYRNKDSPNPITTPHSGNTTMAPNIGRESLMRSDTPLSMLTKSEQQATVSLDPRLQGRFAYTTMTADLLSGLSGSSGAVVEDNRGQEENGRDLQVGGDTESRLQELEDEVLKLKADCVAKDREMRRLKSENEKLRSVSYL